MHRAGRRAVDWRQACRGSRRALGRSPGTRSRCAHTRPPGTRRHRSTGSRCRCGSRPSPTRCTAPAYSAAASSEAPSAAVDQARAM
eukprot:4671201-Prymnesium_polylepis.1